MIFIRLKVTLQYCYREFTSHENALTSKDGMNYYIFSPGLGDARFGQDRTSINDHRASHAASLR